jgi:PPK2 family polyphosphate:nucleotide phosphotransferase
MAERVATASRISDLLRAPVGAVDLTAYDPSATVGFAGDKAAGRAAAAELGPQLADRQECLYANGTAGDPRRVLLVLQGMDTSGKSGTIHHVIGQVQPLGCSIAAFKAPTEEELANHFLWRVRKRVPGPGILGVFDRSHYEDVLVVRVHELVPLDTVEGRYEEINQFEAELADAGTRIIKVFLHISPEEQKKRLLERLDDPTKHWKYNPRDLDERAGWTQYQEAYELAIARCNSGAAPWFIVPADRKWYRNWAVAKLLLEQLMDMNLSWPPADFDVAAERARLLGTG